MPLADISEVEQIIPAAPISCIPTIRPLSLSSKVASNNNFSINGSPTCTLGMSSAEFSCKSALAKVVPCIPSLPVEEPTIYTGFPTPFAVAEIILFVSPIPTDIAFTSGL